MTRAAREFDPHSPLFLQVLGDVYPELSSESRILDFCCGAGRDLRALDDRGFCDLSGYDVTDYVCESVRARGITLRFDAREGSVTELPFPDSYFDVIFSNQTFEHLCDPDGALREIARCLKPTGVSIHIFPPKWRPIEPHIGIPLAGGITWHGYIWFWTRAGIRSTSTASLSFVDSYKYNINYIKNHLFYLSGHKLKDIFSRYFEISEYADDNIYRDTGRIPSWHYRIIQRWPNLRWVYRTFMMRIILLRKPRAQMRTEQPQPENS